MSSTSPGPMRYRSSCCACALNAEITKIPVAKTFIMLFSRYADTARQQRLSHVIRVREVQDRITQQHHQLLVLALEQSRQRLISDLRHDPVSHPLPELRLRRPK